MATKTPREHLIDWLWSFLAESPMEMDLGPNEQINWNKVEKTEEGITLSTWQGRKFDIKVTECPNKAL